MAATLVLQLPIDGALDLALRADPPPSVADGTVALDAAPADDRGRLERPAGGEVVLALPSPEGILRQADDVRRALDLAGAGGQPLVVEIRAASELREEELAPLRRGGPAGRPGGDRPGARRRVKRGRCAGEPLSLLVALAATTALGACGADRPAGGAPAAGPLPVLRARLPGAGRRARASAMAERCRARAAAATRRPRPPGSCGRWTPRALRDQLDTAYTAVARQERPVARVCARVLPFVTPGLAVTVDGTDDDGDGSFSVETESTRPLTIRGRAGGAHDGRVTVARDGRRLAVVPIAADGRFATRPLRLRHVADNTFVLAIDAPPAAPRAVLVSAICLDCLTGAAPPRS